MFCHGKIGFKTLRSRSVNKATWMIRKGKCIIFAIALFGLAIAFNVKELKHQIHPHGPPHHHKPSTDEKPEEPFKFSGIYDKETQR